MFGRKTTLPHDHPLRRAAPAAKPDPPKPKTLKEYLGQVREYLRAEFSLWRKGPVSLHVFDDRKSDCMTCDQREPSPIKGEIGWCKKCSCGGRERSKLDFMLWMPLARCKINKWVEAAGEGLLALRRLPNGVLRHALSVIKGALKEAKRIWTAREKARITRESKSR